MYTYAAHTEHTHTHTYTKAEPKQIKIKNNKLLDFFVVGCFFFLDFATLAFPSIYSYHLYRSLLLHPDLWISFTHFASIFLLSSPRPLRYSLHFRLNAFPSPSPGIFLDFPLPYPSCYYYRSNFRHTHTGSFYQLSTLISESRLTNQSQCHY